MSHRIRCHLKTLFPPNVSEGVQLSNLELIFGSYGIGVELVSGESLNLTAYNIRTYPLVNVDCRLSQVTSQQEELFGKGDFTAILSADVVGYFVKDIKNATGQTLVGCAAHPLFKPRLVIASGASKWTLAHEVGHVLGLEHSSATDNLMYTPTSGITANPPTLSVAQVNTMKSSPFAIGV